MGLHLGMVGVIGDMVGVKDEEEGGKRVVVSGKVCVLELEVVVVVVKLVLEGQLSSLDLARKLTVLIIISIRS